MTSNQSGPRNGPKTGSPTSTRPIRHDPLALIRQPQDPQFDLFLAGDVFLDIIFTGFAHAPAPGTETFASGMGSCPGGIANLAVSAARLGLRTSLAAAFGSDAYGQFCRVALADQEDIDLSRSRTIPNWHSPMTISLAYGGDRALVTHAHTPPVSLDEMIGRPPRARAAVVALGCTPQAWVKTAYEDGCLIFGSVGWDPTHQWETGSLEDLGRCHALLTNVVEATSYTKTSTPEQALRALAGRVPVAIVTCGTEGAIAIDQTTGEKVAVPTLPVSALDTTGAGDVFGAAFVLGTLAEWALADRLAFANLNAALSTQQFGGSLAAPGWGDIADWFAGAEAASATNSAARQLVRRYAFLRDVLPTEHETSVRRAWATIGLRADL